MKTGRPRKFTQKFISEMGDELVKFFEENTDECFITAFCVKIGTYKQKMSEWAAQNEHFAEQLKKAKTICEDRIAKLVVTGRNPAGAIFALKVQHDWKEIIHTENKTEVEAAGGLAAMIAEAAKKEG